MTRQPFPLQWPNNQPRTPAPSRERARFKVTLAEAVEDLLVELDRMGDVHSVVITSDLPTRQDGLPLASGSCDDPGVAVYFVHRGMERVFACDRWDRPAANIRAIGLTLQALRSVERWAASGMVTRVFEGFAALPAPAAAWAAATPDEILRDIAELAPNPASTPQKRTWREVFGVRVVNAKANPALCANALDIIRARYKTLIRTAHPDAGGTNESAAELNVALQEAERELGG